MRANININSRKIGTGYPVYIVAEMSANHNHDFDQAVRIIEAAKEENHFAIGVDSDQDYIAPGNVLTSMLKRVDVELC